MIVFLAAAIGNVPATSPEPAATPQHRFVELKAVFAERA